MIKAEKILDWIVPRVLPIFFGIQTVIHSYHADWKITNAVLFYALVCCTTLVLYKLDRIKEKIDAEN